MDNLMCVTSVLRIGCWKVKSKNAYCYLVVYTVLTAFELSHDKSSVAYHFLEKPVILYMVFAYMYIFYQIIN